MLKDLDTVVEVDDTSTLAAQLVQARKKLTAVASIGRNLENLQAELALERGTAVTSDM